MRKPKTGIAIVVLIVSLLLIASPALGESTDTDGDGWSDLYELWTSKTDPELADTDGDGIIDSEDPEPLNPGTVVQVVDKEEEEPEPETIGVKPDSKPSGPEPFGDSADTDNDGLPDLYELWTSKTDPELPDTDGDGLSDSEDPDPLNPSAVEPEEEEPAEETEEPEPEVTVPETEMVAEEETEITTEEEPIETTETTETTETPADEETPVIPYSWIIIAVVAIAVVLIAALFISRRGSD